MLISPSDIFDLRHEHQPTQANPLNPKDHRLVSCPQTERLLFIYETRNENESSKKETKK